MKEIPYVLIVLIILIFGFSLFLSFNPFKAKKKGNFVKPDNKPKKGDAGRCPLCNSALYSGEQLKSTIYTGGKDSDKRCHILGCPHCFPYLERGVERACPVCKKTIPVDGYLIARLFQRDGNKKHVHIVGCTECHKRD